MTTTVRPPVAGAFPGVVLSVADVRSRFMYIQELGVEVYGGKFGGRTEAGGVAGEVCEIPCKRAFGVAFLRTGGSFDEHLLLLGETIEVGLGSGAPQAIHATAAGFGAARTG